MNVFVDITSELKLNVVNVITTVQEIAMKNVEDTGKLASMTHGVRTCIYSSWGVYIRLVA